MSSAPAALVTEPTPPEPVRAPAKGRRLAWLDALRGFAALCVVFDHSSTLVLQHVRLDVYQWFNAGQYGVFVFFLVSGYIIPASLERKGSVRGFWVSRGFRLYPLYILGIGISLLAWKTGLGPIHGADTQLKTWVYSLPFMMSNMLDGANVPNVIWTLSFEMVFYLLLSALFTFRVHRHSGGYALTAAIGAVALGGILPIQGLSHAIGLAPGGGDRRRGPVHRPGARRQRTAGAPYGGRCPGRGHRPDPAPVQHQLPVQVERADHPGADVHRHHAVPRRAGRVRAAQGGRHRGARVRADHRGRSLAQHDMAPVPGVPAAVRPAVDQLPACWPV